ncbi:DUF6090 family protein [Allomuricauda sp. NBRC 101325]|uniref:DUF6090 family protein n=1 Tax=Allomuricauda sp. NBRC 101325 TaxID=1113758 RepID=UPI0024A1C714|nr:DUF6090 family protein [Muricauda sp. NBRC 101325]GLU44377.1 hypothetical protein Musp01_20010 [Muricauda sp. NBRC 101325]
MIRFFRNIRQRLLAENKFTRYLVYALGEIILVVIGILIALQINNWNENRKLAKQEKETIASLKLEFEKNLEQLEGNIQGIQAFMSAGNTLLEHTGPDYEFGTLQEMDSLLDMTPRMSVWDPSLYTMENIKSSGKLSNLSNEELKLLLIEWDSFYGNLLDWSDFYTERGISYFDFLAANAVNRNMPLIAFSTKGTTGFNRSNEALLRNPLFENILAERVSHNGFMLGFYQEAQRLISEIIVQCETYEDAP